MRMLRSQGSDFLVGLFVCLFSLLFFNGEKLERNRCDSLGDKRSRLQHLRKATRRGGTEGKQLLTGRIMVALEPPERARSPKTTLERRDEGGAKLSGSKRLATGSPMMATFSHLIHLTLPRRPPPRNPVICVPRH